MTNSIDVYSFVFRGDLARASVEQILDKNSDDQTEFYNDLLERLPFQLLDKEIVDRARSMSAVYMLIASFENTARKFIEERLLEDKGENWWEDCVSNNIRDQANRRKEDEENNRFHGARGQSMIMYCQLGDLSSIVQNNFDVFSDYIPSEDWMRQIVKTVERSRNVIMHSGSLSLIDIERVAVNIRDWLRQIGG